MTDCLISFGSNLGDSKKIILEATALLESDEHISQIQTSELLETRPIGGPPDQPQFVNGVWRVQTLLPARELLGRLHQIEREFGRQRRIRWDSRSLDLDLLLYGDQVIAEDECEIPHPRMSFRRFVLQPALTIAGEMLHPICRTSLKQLYQCLEQRPKVIQMLMSPSRQSAIKMRLEALDLEFQLNCFDFKDVDSLQQAQPAMLRVIDLVDIDVVDSDKLTFINKHAELFTGHEGPVLILEGETDDQVVTEVAAAIETMRML